MELRSGRRLRLPQQQPGSRGHGGGGGSGQPDRISSLPEELILLILTLIGCTATAARTSALSRRWRDLWTHLRRIIIHNIARPSIAAAIRRVRGPLPAVSLLELRIPNNSTRPRPFGPMVSNLLGAAVRLQPKELLLSLPWSVDGRFDIVRLPCFHHTTSLVLESIFVHCSDGEFAALHTLSLTYCLGGLYSLLPRCPHLRVLRLDFVSDVFGHSHHGLMSFHLPLLQELFLVTRMAYTDVVDIVAPLLKRLTVSVGTYKVVGSISISAPMLEKVSWQWYYFGGDIVRFGRWSLKRLMLQTTETPPSPHIDASHSFPVSSMEDNFAQEIEKHMVADFSLLELRLLTAGHVFGALVFHLLGIIRISSGIQRLKIVIERPRQLKGNRRPRCLCEHTNWRSQNISLAALKEVEINGFEGHEHEFDLLKLILKCAPVLRRLIVKLPQVASSSNISACTKIYNICSAYSSVECVLSVLWVNMHGSRISPLT